MVKIVTLVVSSGTGGVKDYADLMAAGLRERGLDARVFAWSVETVDAIDLHIAESDCIYLQYSGYGFAKRGAPLWMLRALHKKRAGIRRLGVFFHELYAFGPPWGSAFWLSPLQRHVVARLVTLSDFWLTNREKSKQWLATHAALTPNATLPVFSNVGESVAYDSCRESAIVVFGSAALRKRAWTLAGQPLLEWARRNEMAIHDIGPPMGDKAASSLLNKYGIIQHGRLDSNEVSGLLTKAMYGVLAYPVDYAAKSGVLAAYSAHGITPVLVSDRYAAIDGLTPGEQYLPSSIFGESVMPAWQKIGKSAWRWYTKHTRAVHLETLLDLM